MNHTLQETQINMIAEGTRLEGQFVFDQLTRVHGILIGEVHSKDDSMLILCESSVVKGNIQADTIMIDGYVHGDIHGRKKVIISRTGRVVGNVKTASLILEFGAYFEGQCLMPTELLLTSANLTPKPAGSI